MYKAIGKVIEVFIPNTNINNKEIDIIDSNNIGFKIDINDEIITIIEVQNEHNSKIYKNDKVIITKQKILDKEYVDIDLYEGEYNE